MDVKANEWEKEMTYENVIQCKLCYLSTEKERQSLRVRIIHFTSQAMCDFTATEQDDIQKCH